jgi:hypothetical protein
MADFLNFNILYSNLLRFFNNFFPIGKNDISFWESEIVSGQCVVRFTPVTKNVKRITSHV